MPWETKEGFSYGGRLCSIVGWLGYGGNLTAAEARVFRRTRFGGSHLSGELGQNASVVPRELRTELPAVANVCETAWDQVCR